VTSQHTFNKQLATAMVWPSNTHRIQLLKANISLWCVPAARFPSALWQILGKAFGTVMGRRGLDRIGTYTRRNYRLKNFAWCLNCWLLFAEQLSARKWAMIWPTTQKRLSIAKLPQSIRSWHRSRIKQKTWQKGGSYRFLRRAQGKVALRSQSGPIERKSRVQPH